MIVIQASNIHQGGGAVLLNDLIGGLISLKQKALIYVDSRFSCDFKNGTDIQIIRVRPTILSRLNAEWRLHLDARRWPQTHFLFFGNLPPLFSSSEKVSLFFQNVILLEDSDLYGFKFKTRVKQLVEKYWLRFRLSAVQNIFVQSETVKSKFIQRHPGSSIVVAPFSSAFASSVVTPQVKENKSNYDFIYVASADPHKNHLQLLKAWLYLAQQGVTPSLVLTTDQLQGEEAEVLNQISAKGGVVVLKPQRSHQDIINLYQECRALVFPSLTESFGLPLLEAKQLGLAIIASELDYVRDVVEPNESFNPSSYLSIVRAIRRFLKDTSLQQVKVTDSSSFLKRVLDI